MNSQGSSSSLTADGEALYRRLLREAPADATTHAGELGWPVERMSRCVDELLRGRLIRRVNGGVLRADDPRATLGRLVDQQEAELDRQRQRLLEMRSSIGSFEVDYRRGLDVTGSRLPPWERVSPSEAVEVIEVLIRNSDGELLRASARGSEADGAAGAVWQVPDPALHSGRAARSVFGMTVFDDPDWPAAARACAARGDQLRYLDTIPMEFAVYGTAGVLMARPRPEEQGYYLVRPEPIVTAFTSLFELLWRVAEPVHDEAIAPQNIRILELLALGLKDEAIARHLGLGLRTVRRRLANLMAEYGADNRFQLGLAVARHDLLVSGRSR